jgi:hypothetical protein
MYAWNTLPPRVPQLLTFVVNQARGNRLASFDQVSVLKPHLHFGTGFTSAKNGWNSNIWASASRANAFTDGAADVLLSNGRTFFFCEMRLRLTPKQIRARILQKGIFHSKARPALDHYYPHLNPKAGMDAPDCLGQALSILIPHQSCQGLIVITFLLSDNGTPIKTPCHCLRSIGQALAKSQIRLRRTIN